MHNPHSLLLMEIYPSKKDFFLAKVLTGATRAPYHSLASHAPRRTNRDCQIRIHLKCDHFSIRTDNCYFHNDISSDLCTAISDCLSYFYPMVCMIWLPPSTSCTCSLVGMRSCNNCTCEMMPTSHIQTDISVHRRFIIVCMHQLVKCTGERHPSFPKE